MKKVRWGVLGAGGIADRRTIPGMMLANNAELVAVCDVKKDRADAKAAEFGVKAYYDYIEMLEKEDLDAVVVLVNPDRTYWVADTCLKAVFLDMMNAPSPRYDIDLGECLNVHSDTVIRHNEGVDIIKLSAKDLLVRVIVFIVIGKHNAPPN